MSGDGEETGRADADEGSADATSAEPQVALGRKPTSQRARAAAGRPRRQTVVLAITLVVLVVAGAGIAAYSLLSGDDGDDNAAPTPAAADDFTTPRDSLDGTTATGEVTWSVVNGEFTVADGAARLVPADDRSGSAFAVLDIGAESAEIRSSLTDAQNGAGIVFRYGDEQNYWAVTAAPAYATWNLSRTIDGVTTFVGNFGTMDVTAPTEIVVTQDGPAITVTIGQSRRSVAAANGLESFGVGLVARNDDALTRWQDFAVLSRG